MARIDKLIDIPADELFKQYLGEYNNSFTIKENPNGGYNCSCRYPDPTKWIYLDLFESDTGEVMIRMMSSYLGQAEIDLTNPDGPELFQRMVADTMKQFRGS